MKLPDEVLKYVNSLYDCGVRGNSDHPDGCSTLDEEMLSAMFIKSTPVYGLSALTGLVNWQFWDLLAAYMACQSLENQSAFTNYIVEKVIAYYTPLIEQIFKDKESNHE